MKCIVLINNKLTRGAINSYKMYTYKVNKGYENASLDTRIFFIVFYYLYKIIKEVKTYE